MITFFEKLSESDWISFTAAIASFFLGSVAIWQSYKSIKLTEQSINDANRPYVTIYVETYTSLYYEKNLILKNYGKTVAKIKNINFITSLDDNNESKKMRSAIGSSLMPGQKLSTFIPNEFKETINVKLEYQDLNGKTYTESLEVKTDLKDDFFYTKSSKNTDSSTSTAIKQAAQALIKTLD